ncbi:mucin-2-like isoform X6 [Colius striatus]|uniref:mucin-2-like isoform X6 n=1 Tax=Colius striatus TaxID=57412 RepID=UPI002B1DC3CE|nr:mucin-2-like isoform X6 [Colius striatus]
MAGQRGWLPWPLPLLLLSFTMGTTTTDVTVTVSPTLPTSLTPTETSALLPTTDSTTTATLPTSSPEMGASTSGSSSPSPRTGSSSAPTMPPPTTPAPTALADTTATPAVSTESSGSTPMPSQLAGTTPGISTLTVESSPGILTVPGVSSAATGMEHSSPTADSTQAPEVSFSTPADLPTTLPVCPTAMSNTSTSHLFLSLRLTIPLDLGNTTVQELVLSKLRGDLQTTFPCAGVAVEWRGKRRT